MLHAPQRHNESQTFSNGNHIFNVSCLLVTQSNCLSKFISRRHLSQICVLDIPNNRVGVVLRLVSLDKMPRVDIILRPMKA